MDEESPQDRIAIPEESKEEKRRRWMREYQKRRRDKEKIEATLRRQEEDRIRAAMRRASESREQREVRQDNVRVATAERRTSEGPEEKRARLMNDCISVAIRRASESSDRREVRLENVRAATAERRANETAEEYESRSQGMRQYRERIRVALVNPHEARKSAIDVEEISIGSMNIPCLECHALHFEKERNAGRKFSTCCNSGKVKLPELTPYPEPLATWLQGESVDSKHFRSHARKYNCAFGFSSFLYNAFEHRGAGPQTFVIHGQVYHKAAQYATVEGHEKPTYSQLYFLDPDFANQARINNEHNTECKSHIIVLLDALLREVNPYAQAYKMMREVVQHEQSAGRLNSEVKMRIVKVTDQKRHNLPVHSNEVAAVFTSGEGNEEDFQREICIHPRGPNNALINIPISNSVCDPMTYPLLFPHGDHGWSYDIFWGGKKISICKYYSYRLQIRPIFSPLLHASKLTQQYIVDAYLKVEAERLNFVRKNQSQLRVESYQGLMDFVSTQAEHQNLIPGKLLILPSTFCGSKRSMQQSYQDAMVMVAAFGKPDLFITFTCNPKWKEIVDNIGPHETTIDRPDVVATVFHLKLKEFIKEMTVKNVLGKVTAFQYVIEFQKRGLPHCHMLFILADDDKLRDVEDIDAVVCAEIPDEVEDPALFNIVTSALMHGPCGALNPSSVCMEKDSDGKAYCRKKYPKDICNETTINSNGYPEYRRRNNNRTVTTSTGQVLDNSWVVPYNKYFCKMFNAHINVEVCSSIKSVKYIYKYIYKGHDAAVVKINEKGGSGYYNWDEIQAYVEARYLSAPEAMWRLRKYEMQDRSHTIKRLAVHLPLQQSVVFNRNGTENQQDPIQAALAAAARKLTTLMAWFELNKEDPNARKYLYREIPLHYVQDDKTHKYKPRVRNQNKILPRMYAVSPKDMERYALRLLLLHVRGATSFEGLRTVDGVLYDTFRGAAVALQLLEDDNNWNLTMEEALGYQMPSQLRQLYGAICEFGFPTDPKAMFYKFKEHLIEDYLRQTGDEELAFNMCLKDLEGYFLQFSHTCQHFGLPAPVDFEDISDLTTNVDAERQEAEHLIGMLNDEQRRAYDLIMDAVDGRSNKKCFFLSGAGGCGKTFLYRALICTLLGRHQRVKAVAPTGLAATLFKNGQTIHSGFGLGLDISSTTTSNIRQGSKQWKHLTETKLIIWDEISMCTKDIFDAVDRSLQDLLGKPGIPFGGIPIVVGGDFRQQAPVLKRASRLRIIEACVKKSKIWPKFQHINLQQNMRVEQDEVQFTEWLLKIGSGMTDEDKRSDHVAIPETNLSSDILSDIFGESISSLSSDEIASRAILSPLNADTLRINETILATLPGEMKTYYSIDKVADCETEEEEGLCPLEFLNSITPMGLPPHKLNLKDGCCVMLLRNLNPKQGLCNGTRLIVERMTPNVLYCSIFSGDRKGTQVLIPRLLLDTNDMDLPFKLRRKQFPIRLAYSMTITKSQGQTFDKIGVFLPKPVFAHGQLYTALSRVKSQSGLFVQIVDGTMQGKIFEGDEKTYIYNCVFDELL